MTQETTEQRLEKIRARQLARMMSLLREVNAATIIQQAVERYFNFYHEDVRQIINNGAKGQHDKSSTI